MDPVPAGSVCICTLGCAKNEVDSAKMRDRLVQAGYAVIDEPAEADVVIVNTCSFIQQATEESIEAVLEAFELPRVERGEARVIVAGCMPARYGSELESEMGEAAAFVPCAEEGDIVAAVESAMPDARLGAGGARPDSESGDAELPFAYVKISDGCDRRCAYCTIPSIRGPYRSFPYEQIAGDVRACVGAGKREVVLVAQDTGRWGADMPDGRDLAWLLAQLAEEHQDTLFRVMYIQPDGVTDRLIDAIASHGNIASYLDVPLQHVDPGILRAMRRGGGRSAFEELAARLRSGIPGVTLRTTLIAGFPGETQEQFDELLDFAGSGCFDHVGVFAYSQEEGTPAAELPDQIDEDEKAYRAQMCRDAADAASALAIAERIRSVQRVLVEGREEDGQLFGRAECQAPEVDGITYVDAGEPGEFAQVVIEDTLLYDMEGTVTDGQR